MPAAGSGGFIYLYVHFDNLTYDLGKEESDIECKITKEPELVWSKTIEKPGMPEPLYEIDVTVLDSDGNPVDLGEIHSLPIGAYTVIIEHEYDEPFIQIVELESDTGNVLIEYKRDYIVGGNVTAKRIDLPFIKKPLQIINKTVKL